VADVLENIAANSTHTPALYAAFLRALISAKLAPQRNLVDKPEQDQGDDNVGAGPTLSIYESPSSSTHVVPSPLVPHPASLSPDTSIDPNLQLHQALPPHSQPEASGNGFFNDPQNYYMNEFHFESEMGPATDITTFPPTMAVPPNSGEDSAMMSGLTMENILSSGFWDNMLVPGASSRHDLREMFCVLMRSVCVCVCVCEGYNSMDGFSGGCVFGTGGSGLITPRFGLSPVQSGVNTPLVHASHSLTQGSINMAFDHVGQAKDGIKIDT